MRMHTASPPPATVAVAPPLQLQVATLQPAESSGSATDPAAFVDRYCQDCDIRFSSLKTFRAHKLHYCSTRHVQKVSLLSDRVQTIDLQRTRYQGGWRLTLLFCLQGSVAAGSSESTSPSPVDGAPAHPHAAHPHAAHGAMPTARPSAASPGSDALLVLPTNPPMLVPYSLLQAASVVQGSALNATLGAALGPALGAACLLMLPDGSLQPVATANLPAPPPSPRHRPTPAPQPPPSPSPQPQSQPAPPRRRETKSSPAPPTGHSPGSAPASGLGPLDLSLRRNSDCSDQDEDDKENRSHIASTSDHEDIVCAPSIPLMLSASSTCSSPSGPSPSPPPSHPGRDSGRDSGPPPPSRKRPHSPSLSPTAGKKSPRRTPNGLVTQAQAGLKKEVVTVDDGPAVTDPQLLLQSVLASRGLPPGSASLLLGSPLSAPLELALRMAAASAASAAAAVELQPPPPQVYVKHGVSKCKECNIVFCRHENYLAHKRHYCQARLQEEADDSASSPGATAGTSVGAPGAVARTSRSPSANSPPEPPSQPPPGAVSPAMPSPATGTLVQYTCALCHIKFTSLDNLTHHQAYYCPKRQDNATAPVAKVVEDKTRRRCPKCKVSKLVTFDLSFLCGIIYFLR